MSIGLGLENGCDAAYNEKLLCVVGSYIPDSWEQPLLLAASVGLAVGVYYFSNWVAGLVERNFEREYEREIQPVTANNGG